MQLDHSDAALFRGSRWLDIAVALRDEPRTLQQCAHVLGVKSGVIYRQLHDMLDAGLLITDGPATGRGSRFHLDPIHVDALDRQLAGEQLGHLQSGQHLLFVHATSLLAFARALSNNDLAAPVVWAAQFDNDDFLLGLDAQLSPVLRARLRATLEARDGACQAHSVTQLLGAAELRGFLAAVRDAAI